ncbi:hypothetical protein TNCV_1774671 [Trichonephila clavipes]|nr:hypothetical protein TNCV_1774671 [Trichonephila clavipes]
MTFFSYFYYHSWQGSQEAIFHQDNAHSKPEFHPSLACSMSRFVTNRAYLGSFRAASWRANEFGRIKGSLTPTMEQGVTGHHTVLACLIALPYHIMPSC